MSVTCDKCGKATRTVYYYLHKSIPASALSDGDRLLPRSAIAVLNPDLEASIPWGDHPNDDDFKRMCHSCFRQNAKPSDERP